MRSHIAAIGTIQAVKPVVPIPDKKVEI